jgi:hypothetical protein
MSPRIQGRSISRSIASPRSNISAFLDVTVNGVSVVVTVMLRPGNCERRRREADVRFVPKGDITRLQAESQQVCWNYLGNVSA